jgi:uncharacterized phage protein (TIGR01671 family)
MIYYTLRELIETILSNEYVYHYIKPLDNVEDLMTAIDHNDLESPQMQYTGHFDMNSVDIYEDDIIDFHGSIGVVKEDPYVMGWYIEGVSEDDYTFYNYHGTNFEFNEIKVIGNIHENTELIK